jgi:uncharacterized repeat protein (TIGR02543 family)
MPALVGGGGLRVAAGAEVKAGGVTALSVNEAYCETAVQLHAAVSNPDIDTVYLDEAEYQLTALLTLDRDFTFYGPESGTAVIKPNANNRHIHITVAEVELTFEGVILDGGLEDAQKTGENLLQGGIEVSHTGAGTYIINGAVVQNCYNRYQGGGIKTYVTAAQELILNDCTVDNCRSGYAQGTLSANGGGVFASGNITLNNCTITNNKSFEQAGGVYAYKTLTIDGGMISGNSTANNHGGGVYVWNNGCESVACAVTGEVVFENNTANSNGGGIFTNTGNVIFDCESLIMTGNSGSNGSGVFATGGDISLQAASANISDNLRSAVLYAGGELTVSDGTAKVQESPNILFKNNVRALYAAKDITVRGNVTFEANGYVSGASAAYATYFKVNVIVTGHKTTVIGGAVNISGGKITGNGGENSGGNGVIQGTQLIAENCEFSDNSYAGYGAIGFIDTNEGKSPLVQLTDCTLIGNENRRTDGDAAGILYTRDTKGVSKVELSGCTVKDNFGTRPVILGYYGFGEAVLDNCLFEDNVITSDYSYASILYSRYSSKITVDKCQFIGNSGYSTLYVHNDITIKNSLFESNESTRPTYGGGAVYISGGSANGLIENCEFIGNTAKNSGGAIYSGINSASVYLMVKDSVFTDNKADGAGAAGGAIYTTSLTSLKTDGVTFRDNSASNTLSWILGSDAVTHEANIADTSYTAPFLYAYNNADIGYYPSVPRLVYCRNHNDEDGASNSGGQLTPGSAMPPLYTAAAVADLGWNRDGWAFVGWAVNSDGTGEIPPEMPGETLKLYAQWTPACTVRFVDWDGTEVKQEIVALGNSVAAPTDLSRGGYRFTGWNTLADGNGILYAADDTITVTEDMTLYAQWAYIPPFLPDPPKPPEPNDPEPDEPEPPDDPEPPDIPEPPPEPPEDPEPGDEPPDIPVPPAPPESGGNSPAIPPAPNYPGDNVELSDDGVYIERDEDGTPLGEWRYDEEEDAWIFEEYPPLGAAEPPRTGDAGVAAPAATFAISLLAAAAILTARRRRAK